jgi:hypothetical protein
MFFKNSNNDTTLVPFSNSHWWHIGMCLILTLISNILLNWYGPNVILGIYLLYTSFNIKYVPMLYQPK